MLKYCFLIIFLILSPIYGSEIYDFYQHHFDWIKQSSEEIDEALNAMNYCAKELNGREINIQELCQGLGESDPVLAMEKVKTACERLDNETATYLNKLGYKIIDENKLYENYKLKMIESNFEFLFDFTHPEKIRDTIEKVADSNIANKCYQEISRWRIDKITEYISKNNLDKNILERQFYDYVLNNDKKENITGIENFSNDFYFRIFNKLTMGGDKIQSKTIVISNCQKVFKNSSSAFFNFLGDEIDCSPYNGLFCEDLFNAQYELIKTIDNDKIYSKENLNKLDSMLSGLKEHFYTYIKNMDCVSEDFRKEMNKRVSNTKIKKTSLFAVSKLGYNCMNSACCNNCDSDNPEIFFPPKYIALLNNGFEKSIEMTMMHELAHAMVGGYSKTDHFISCDGARLKCIKNKYKTDLYKNVSYQGKQLMYHEAFSDDVQDHIIEDIFFNSIDKEREMQEILKKACYLAGSTTTYNDHDDIHPLNIERIKKLLLKPGIIQGLKCENRFDLDWDFSCDVVGE